MVDLCLMMVSIIAVMVSIAVLCSIDHGKGMRAAVRKGILPKTHAALTFKARYF